MTDAEFDAALDAVVAATRTERLRHLCRDHPDPAVRSAFRDWVIREHLGTAPPPPPIAVDYGAASPGPCGGCPGW